MRYTLDTLLWAPLKIQGIIRDNQKIWFRATKDNDNTEDEDYIASLTLKEGYLKYEYKFTTKHKVPK